jgi:S1-C subfamily serine protease
VFQLAVPKPQPQEALELVDEPAPKLDDRSDAIRSQPIAIPAQRLDAPRPARRAPAKEIASSGRMAPVILAVAGGLLALGAVGGVAGWLLSSKTPDSVRVADNASAPAKADNSARQDEAPKKGPPTKPAQDADKDRVPPEAAAPPPPLARAEPKPAEPAGGDGKLPAAALAALKAATVFVKVNLGKLEASGSGFLMRVDGNVGYVVTNDHVIAAPPRLRIKPRVSLVFWSGTKQEKTVSAQVVATDPDRDIAMLKVTGLPEFPAPLDLEQRVELTETMTVWILGFPFGEMLAVGRGNPALTIGKGTISSIRTDASEETKIVQIDGDVNPGNSGGPVVDSAGRLVGISQAKIKGTHIGLAIPPIELTRMLNGRIGAVGFRTLSSDSSSAEVQVEAKLIDPLNKITAVGIHYVRADAARASVKRGRDGLFPPLPGGKRVELNITDQKAQATFKVAAGQGTAFLFQAVYTNGDGKTIYTAPSRFTTTPKPVDTARPTPAVPSGKEPMTKDTKEDLSGKQHLIGDLSVAESKLQVREAVPCMCWAGDGKSLYFLERNGILRQIVLEGFIEERNVDLGRKVSWLSRSAEGLLLALPDQQEAWLLDAKTFKVKAKMDAPSVTHALSAASLSVGFAFNHQGDSVHILDLKAGKTSSQKEARDFEQPVGLARPAITPDGKYVFTTGGSEQVYRLRIAGKDLKFEEASQRIIQGRFDGLCISGDGAFVCAPSGGGNYPGLRNHPQVGTYSTYIYPVQNLNKPAFAIHQGAYPVAVGFDAKAGLVYTQNHERQLIVFTNKGIKLKEYQLYCGEPRQYLVHPQGRKVLMLTNSELLLVTLPEK